MQRHGLGFVLVVMALLILALFGRACCISGCGADYSNGDRSGQVIKLSKKGLFIKSWEGTLNLGGMSVDSDGHAQPTTFDFTVRNENLVPKLQDALLSGKRIKLTYRQWLISPVSMDSHYELVTVTE